MESKIMVIAPAIEFLVRCALTWTVLIGAPFAVKTDVPPGPGRERPKIKFESSS